MNGLSPLARGTHSRVVVFVELARFIPAGAGNTRVEKEAQLREAVYPRWRGEHRTAVPLRDIELGLSPLARGTLRAGLIEAPDVRFIPAGAGNTDRDRDRAGRSAVYPRWRGEHNTRSNNG